jgi:hypothetical protein
MTNASAGGWLLRSEAHELRPVPTWSFEQAVWRVIVGRHQDESCSRHPGKSSRPAPPTSPISHGQRVRIGVAFRGGVGSPHNRRWMSRGRSLSGGGLLAH